MKNSTKLILIGIAALGVVWFIRSKRKTPIILKKKPETTPINNTPAEEVPGSIGSTTNAGTTLTTPLSPVTPIFSDEINLSNEGVTNTGVGSTTNTGVGSTTSSGNTGTGTATSGTSSSDSSTSTTTNPRTAGIGISITPTPAPQNDPCAPQDGFIITKYDSSISNITRVRQECQRSGGRWASTRTGGCCIKPQTSPTTLGQPSISTSPVSSSASSSSCFVADTFITMADGEKIKIQDVKIGMEVLAWNEDTKNQEFSKVTETIISSNTALITIKTKSGIKLTCTKEHPFWVKGGWVQAMLLEKGDILMLEDGKYDEIISADIDFVSETSVYNLHISDNHTYYANSVLVHNKDVFYDVTYTGPTAQAIVAALQNIFAYNVYDTTANPNSGYY